MLTVFKGINFGDNKIFLNYKEKHVTVKYSTNQNNTAISE